MPTDLPTRIRALLDSLPEGATEGPWRACAWDPMERPHVHKDTPGQTHCGPRSDLPLNAADAHLIAAAPALRDLLREAASELERVSTHRDRLLAIVERNSGAIVAREIDRHAARTGALIREVDSLIAEIRATAQEEP